jgi:hypothetical protein
VINKAYAPLEQMLYHSCFNTFGKLNFPDSSEKDPFLQLMVKRKTIEIAWEGMG